tara:strand:+ start:614 stop:1297 length:684 start_codon:yes stop_codon:yes gene_type:complete
VNRELFFPSLKRQPVRSYYTTLGNFYAASNYQSNYEKVAADCLHRCVYCDATEKECGGERFSLDHFRPKDVFINKFNGILVQHPYNLHLSCQKCNVLKSKDWHGCENTINGYSYSSGKGYVDRFREDLHKFVEVSADGRIYVKAIDQPHPKNPAQYMIERMHLNRPNRVFIRQKRVITKVVNDIEDLLAQMTEETTLHWRTGTKSGDECMKQIIDVEAFRARFISIK